MRVIRSDNDSVAGRSVVTVGSFDGVHLAHREIIARMRRDADAMNAGTVVVTFDPHPQEVLHTKHAPVRLLTTIDERLALLAETGLDTVVVIRFTEEFSRTPADVFVREVLVRRCGAARVVVGPDHGFGKGRAGDIELLERIGAEEKFSVVAVDALMLDGRPVSSTRIREALDSGDVAEAARLLGRPHVIAGTVVAGDARGSTIGFPTANIEMNSPVKLVPANGVYAVRVVVDDARYAGMMNIGTRPTVSSALQRTIEVNIFEFSRRIYGSPISVELIARLRSETAFPSLDALKEQLYRDREESLRILQHNTHPSLQH